MGVMIVYMYFPYSRPHDLCGAAVQGQTERAGSCGLAAH